MSLRCTSRSSGRPRRFYRVAPPLQLRATLQWGENGALEDVTLLDVSEGGCSVARARDASCLKHASLFGRVELKLRLDAAEGEQAPVVLKLRSEHGSRLGFEFTDRAASAVRAFRERVLAIQNAG